MWAAILISSKRLTGSLSEIAVVLGWRLGSRTRLAWRQSRSAVESRVPNRLALGLADEGGGSLTRLFHKPTFRAPMESGSYTALRGRPGGPSTASRERPKVGI